MTGTKQKVVSQGILPFVPEFYHFKLRNDRRSCLGQILKFDLQFIGYFAYKKAIKISTQKQLCSTTGMTCAQRVKPICQVFFIYLVGSR